jgi:hypothetical protein
METMTLTQANREWATRPADERVADLQQLHDKALAQRAAAAEKDVPFDTLRVESHEDNLYLTRGTGASKLTNWAFTQLAQRVAAPAEYLSGLPGTLAAQNLNHGLAKRVKDAAGSAVARVLFHKNGEWLVRALTTDVYERIWNVELTERLLDKQSEGWEPARPDFNKREDDFPSLYLGDRNMFAFIRLANQTIEQPVQGFNGTAPIYKGYICWNSEVGDKKIGGMSFLYNGMCGNHLIWGAQDVFEFEARHVGNVRDQLQLFSTRVREYARKSMKEDEAVIKRASHKMIAATKEDVLDALFGKRSLNLSRKTIEAGYDAVLPEQDGPAETVWGMVQGLTRHSQTLTNADTRTQVDKSAGKLLDMIDSF